MTSPRQLIHPNEISDHSADSLVQVKAWITRFIMRPHPALERTGAVCPYVQPSIEEHSLFVSIATPTSNNHFDDIYNEVMQYAELFHQIPKQKSDLGDLRALVVLFPEAHSKMLDDPKSSFRLKTDLLEQDIMLGQFFPKETVQEQLAEKFFLADPPCPLYVLRAFTSNDWPFINGEKAWRGIYQAKFGTLPN